jgi:hypothetical protein
VLGFGYTKYFNSLIFILYQDDPLVNELVLELAPEALPGQLASFTFETSIARSYPGATHLVDAHNYRYNNIGFPTFLRIQIEIWIHIRIRIHIRIHIRIRIEI